jgi:hypothetical protein
MPLMMPAAPEVPAAADAPIVDDRHEAAPDRAAFSAMPDRALALCAEPR